MTVLVLLSSCELQVSSLGEGCLFIVIFKGFWKKQVVYIAVVWPQIRLLIISICIQLMYGCLRQFFWDKTENLIFYGK